MADFSNLPANNQTERKIKELAESVSVLGETIIRLRDEISGLISLAEKILDATNKQNIVLENMPSFPALTKEEVDFLKKRMRLAFDRKRKAM